MNATNTQENPIIQVRDLYLDYNHGEANEIRVIKGMSFDVNKGDVICIIGPSGTGKSSLIRCLNGLTVPSYGEIIIDGENIYTPGFDIRKARENIGFVFQQFELFPHMSVLDNVALALTKVKHVPKTEAQRRAMEALKKVGLAEKANESPANISGGQKQRVAIARALAQDPKIILFDEPTSALDPELIGEVLKVMEDIARAGMTMLVVTHEIDFARDVGTRVLFLDQGKIWEEGVPENIFTRPRKERTWQFLNASKLLKGKEPPASFEAPEHDAKSIEKDYQQHAKLIDENAKARKAGERASTSLSLGAMLAVPFVLWPVTGPLAIVFGAMASRVHHGNARTSTKATVGIVLGTIQIIAFIVIMYLLMTVFGDVLS